MVEDADRRQLWQLRSKNQDTVKHFDSLQEMVGQMKHAFSYIRLKVESYQLQEETETLKQRISYIQSVSIDADEDDYDDTDDGDTSEEDESEF